MATGVKSTKTGKRAAKKPAAKSAAARSKATAKGEASKATNGKSSAANPSGVQGICPKNTHIPSQAEWDELFDAVGGKVQAQDKLRSTTGWPTPNQNTDAIGFNMLPGGGYSYRYTNMDTAAYFWTSDAYSSGGYYGINAYYPGLNATPYVNSSPQVWKFSCRCVVD